MSIDVIEAMVAVEGWAREVSDEFLDSEPGMRKSFCHDLQESAKARAAVAELIAAGHRVTAAFRVLGEAEGIRQNWNARHECESAMIALADALAACKESSHG